MDMYPVTLSVRAVALALLVLIFPASLLAQEKGKPVEFPYEAFSANENIARWLVAYDEVAWQSSDLVVKEPEEELHKLGREWFCFQDAQGAWHAIYGRYSPDTKKYETIFHYVRRGDAALARTHEAVDPELAARYGRAIHGALAHLPEGVADLDIAFNRYVRKLDDGKLEVWVLPGGQRDGTLIFGGDLRYVFDPTGNELVTQELNFKEFRGIRPGPKVKLEIDRQQNDVASVGDIFFLLSFRNQFDNVTVRARCYLTRLLDTEGKGSDWVQAHLDKPDCIEKVEKREE